MADRLDRDVGVWAVIGAGLLLTGVFTWVYLAWAAIKWAVSL